MLEILNSSKQTIKKNIALLAEDYKEKTGRIVCLFCPSDIDFMISSLKIIYKMKNFEFTKEFAQYKNKKGATETISNSTMTDEKAIEFLKTNPKRISLFKTFPKNWKQLIKKGKDKAATATNQAAEAEQEANNQIDLVDAVQQAEANKIETIVEGDISPERQAEIEAEKAVSEATGEADKDCCDDDTTEEPCDECIEKKRIELNKMTVANLEKAYPEFKGKYKRGSKKADFVDLILKA